MANRTHRLTIWPVGKKIDVDAGTLLLDAVRQAGIEIRSPCNGQKLCGKCKVRITSATLPAASPEHLTRHEAASGIRLACQVAVREDMQVAMIEDYCLDARILEGDRIRKSRIKPAAAIRKIGGRFQLVYRNRPPVTVKYWQPDYSAKGIAVDLGTTTLVVTLLDLQTGAELATGSTVNPQVRFGLDVLTRIHKASTPQGLAELSLLVSNALNTLVGKICRASGAHPHEIVDAVIGGNTAMLQIAAAINPAPLGTLPFRTDLQGSRTYPATRYRLNLNPQARVYIPAVRHAFVGSDISAGLLSTDFFRQTAPVLFMDLGTNGEMALIADGRQVVTSAAAGPAFEGMGITYGMRAAPGAIEIVWTHGEHLALRTIDDVPAKGICGSGIMDLMACLIRTGWIDPGGRLKNPDADDLRSGPVAARYAIVDRIAAINLTDDIYFSQKDIRQFQLARSAVKTGIDMLLSAAGMAPERLEKIVIAGAFGYHLRVESLRQVGIVSRNFEGEIEFAGNTCRTGCAQMLLDASSRDFLRDRMQAVTHVSIAQAPDFQSRFIRNISLLG